MADTNIEWADATWNPVVGCTPVSAGCANCYAATMARRLEGMGVAGYEEHDGLRIAEVRGGRAVFTGSVRCIDDRIAEPLRWSKPRRIFVCSMSDLFHEVVPFDFIDRVFAVAAISPQHRFLMLTKRPERMAEYTRRRPIAQTEEETGGIEACRWPLPNVWIGTSVEDQRAADARIPHLLRCPAAVRFLSVEPLLGPVDLECVGDGLDETATAGPRWSSGIHWVIVGGESGPKARRCNVDWIRGVVRQCSDANVPCFVKQLGSRPIDHKPCLHTPGAIEITPIVLHERKGGDPSEWPEDLRVRQWPRQEADRG